MRTVISNVVEVHLAQIGAVNPKASAVVMRLATSARAAAGRADSAIQIGDELGPSTTPRWTRRIAGQG